MGSKIVIFFGNKLQYILKIAYGIFWFLIIALATSCLKPPDYPEEPQIEYVSVSKNAFLQGLSARDSVIIAFTFTDGDGDLGSDDSLNVFVTDSRDNFTANKYRIPFIPEEGTANGISGEIFITVFSTCCYFPDNTPPCTPSETNLTDSLQYKIQIRDRADNWSNEVLTEKIYVICN